MLLEATAAATRMLQHRRHRVLSGDRHRRYGLEGAGAAGDIEILPARQRNSRHGSVADLYRRPDVDGSRSIDIPGCRLKASQRTCDRRGPLGCGLLTGQRRARQLEVVRGQCLRSRDLSPVDPFKGSQVLLVVRHHLERRLPLPIDRSRAAGSACTASANGLIWAATEDAAL